MRCCLAWILDVPARLKTCLCHNAGGPTKFPCGMGNCCLTGKEMCSSVGMCVPASSPPPPAYLRKRSLMGLKDE